MNPWMVSSNSRTSFGTRDHHCGYQLGSQITRNSESGVLYYGNQAAALGAIRIDLYLRDQDSVRSPVVYGKRNSCVLVQSHQNGGYYCHNNSNPRPIPANHCSNHQVQNRSGGWINRSRPCIVRGTVAAVTKGIVRIGIGRDSSDTLAGTNGILPLGLARQSICLPSPP